MGCDDYRVVQGEIVQPNFTEGPSPLNPGMPGQYTGDEFQMDCADQPGEFVTSERGIKAVDQTKILLKLREVDGPSPVDKILVKHLPEVVQLFRAKARDYQAEGVFTADALGARGQFADLWRKVPKLKKAMWDGEELVGEQAEEILMDFFGHVMLAIGYLNQTR